jgi:hypothetical protein
MRAAVAQHKGPRHSLGMVAVAGGEVVVADANAAGRGPPRRGDVKVAHVWPDVAEWLLVRSAVAADAVGARPLVRLAAVAALSACGQGVMRVKAPHSAQCPGGCASRRGACVWRSTTLHTVACMAEPHAAAKPSQATPAGVCVVSHTCRTVAQPRHVIAHPNAAAVVGAGLMPQRRQRDALKGLRVVIATPIPPSADAPARAEVVGTAPVAMTRLRASMLAYNPSWAMGHRGAGSSCTADAGNAARVHEYRCAGPHLGSAGVCKSAARIHAQLRINIVIECNALSNIGTPGCAKAQPHVVCKT